MGNHEYDYKDNIIIVGYIQAYLTDLTTDLVKTALQTIFIYYFLILMTKNNV